MNLDSPCHFLPYGVTEIRESKVYCSNLINGDSSSSQSSNEENQDTTPDYLNPYTPVIKMSPPKKEEYLTLATVHKVDGGPLDNFTKTNSKNHCLFKHHQQLATDAFNQLYHNENRLINIGCKDSQLCLSNIKEHVFRSCENFNIKRLQDKRGVTLNLVKDNSPNCFNIFKSKSESDIFVRKF